MKVKILLSAFIASTLLAFPVQAQNFSDVSADNMYADSIEYLLDTGVVEGYSDGTYKPEAWINRAEFLKIVMEASGQDSSGKDCYKDVTDEWFAPYVCGASTLKFVKGYDDGYFRPEQNINFAEASKIIANVMDLIAADEDSENWYKNYIYALEDYAAIPTSILGVAQNINRGEMSEMIFRLERGVDDKKYNTYESLMQNKEADHDNESLKPFRSCYALGAYLDSPEDVLDYAFEEMVMMSPPVASDIVVKDSATNSKSDEAITGGGESDDFSTTNVQVEGVDEADIVKTDGEYIYVVKGSTVRVVDAKPAREMYEMDAVTFGDDGFRPQDMYVDGNRLIVIGTAYSPRIYPYEFIADYDVTDVYFGGKDQTILYVFDISDKANIEEIRSVAFDGNYDSSRKIDDMVYVVSNQYKYYMNGIVPYEEGLLPLYKDSTEDKIMPMSGCSDVSYMPGPRDGNGFMTVSGVPVDNVGEKVVTEVVIGNSNAVYASRDNMYISQQKYGWNNYWGGDSSEEETIIHKFALGKKEIVYKGKGKVPGHILNQFSMDEYDGNFRIATTKGDLWNSTTPSTNNVYVLDSQMDLIGELEGLAPGEKIYSVRFMGKRGYIVTFKKVDPLFVIDLATPSAPKVLGKLKIPGYSDYLHPYDENHIIGFGKDAVDAQADLIAARELDFAWYQGIKIAMFDVTDVTNPVELHKIVIGDRGTDSELLWNHKALLFDKEKGIMAFPITVYEIPENVKNDPNVADNTYGDPVFQGAYVYDVSVEDGFDFKGSITQYTDNEIADKAGYYWWGDKDIKRILYIGDYFYTISQAAVKASFMRDLRDASMIDFKDLGDDLYDYYWEY